MSCSHAGFHAIRTTYDRQSGILVYFWMCEVCGEHLGEVRRERYRPHYDRRATQRFQPVPQWLLRPPPSEPTPSRR
jgi:hypothetical protein